MVYKAVSRRPVRRNLRATSSAATSSGVAMDCDRGVVPGPTYSWWRRQTKSLMWGACSILAPCAQSAEVANSDAGCAPGAFGPVGMGCRGGFGLEGERTPCACFEDPMPCFGFCTAGHVRDHGPDEVGAVLGRFVVFGLNPAGETFQCFAVAGTHREQVRDGVQGEGTHEGSGLWFLGLGVW